MKRHGLLLCLLVLMLQAMAQKTDYTRLITQGVTYTGRTLAHADGSVSFDWIGVYAQTDFTGGTIAVDMSSTRPCYFNVFIDGEWTQKIFADSLSHQRIVLAEKLGKGTHRLRLQRACEGNGITTIHGFYGAKGARLKAVERKSRMIEIFGDSYTCGYGSDSPTQNEHFKIETENVDHAYGCLIARYFDTDYAIQAHSGQGMVRNYGDKKQRSDYSMLDRHTKVYDNDKTVEYDFKAYRPDIVLINLGTNDFSREVTPTPDQYVGNYVKMIKSLRSHYGNVPILCIMPHSARKYLQACFPILRERCYDDKQVYFAEPMLEVLRDGRDYGADGHPNYQGHRGLEDGRQNRKITKLQYNEKSNDDTGLGAGPHCRSRQCRL